MTMKGLNRWLWVFFSLCLVGYFYLFGTMLIFYILNFFVGLMVTVGLPLLVWGAFYLAVRWLVKNRESDLPEGFSSTGGYARFWGLRLELGLLILGTLVLSGVFPEGWPVSLYWLVLGVVTFILHPPYMKRTLRRAMTEGDEDAYQEKERSLIIVSSLYSGMALVVGAAGFVLGILGLLIGQ